MQALPRRGDLVLNVRDGAVELRRPWAFKSAGADDDETRRAAEALSGAAHSAEIADLKSTQKLHTWMLGFNTAMLAAVMFRVFGT